MWKDPLRKVQTICFVRGLSSRSFRVLDIGIKALIKTFSLKRRKRNSLLHGTGVARIFQGGREGGAEDHTVSKCVFVTC